MTYPHDGEGIAIPCSS